MRFWRVATTFLLATTSPCLARPQPIPQIEVSGSSVQSRDASSPPGVVGLYATVLDEVRDLWKRKGGGGGGGKGGSSSSSSGGKTGSSSSSSSSGKTGLGSSTSSTGGRTTTGSGVAPAFGGGRYYGGGATTPYASGAHSPHGIIPLLLGVGVGSALFLYHPLLWPYGAYSYSYNHTYTFHNRSANSSNTNTTSTKTKSKQKRSVDLSLFMRDTTPGVNETKPVICLCALYAECGCDDDGNTTVLDSLIGTGDYNALNQTLVTVADLNGTSTILLNGTLANGTTAAGGTADPNAAGTMSKLGGYWVMVVLVLCSVLVV